MQQIAKKSEFIEQPQEVPMDGWVSAFPLSGNTIFLSFFATGFTLWVTIPEPVIWQLTDEWTEESLQLLKKKKKLNFFSKFSALWVEK